MNYHVYLKNAIVAISEVDSTFIGRQSTEKFAELKSDLMRESKEVILLSFKEIWKKSDDVRSSNFMKSFKH